MLRTLIGASLLGTLLAGCATQTPGPTAQCAQLFQQLQRVTQPYRDGQYHRLPGFVGLRSDRSLAALGNGVLDAEQRRLWLQRLAALDRHASRIELAQLPGEPRQAWLDPPRQTRLDACRTAQVERLLHEPQAFATAAKAAQVADDYRTWARLLGLYVLFKPVFSQGVSAWQQGAAQLKAPPDSAQWLSYQPPRTMAEHTPLTLNEDALGLPQADSRQLETLFARHAPWLRVAQASSNDRIGTPFYRADGERDFNQQSVPLFQHIGWSKFQGRWHLQLIYQFWFRQRPKPHALDLFGGELDGLLWRVTLDTQGNALLYDSIHPCGCWHSFYLPADSPWRLRPNAGDEARLTQRLSFTGKQAATLWLSAGEHQLQWVDARRSAYPGLSYQPAPLDQLRQLPHPQGQRSLYQADGLIAGSQRLERWLLWPSGVAAPGSMRQWGRHATAFIGRAHFDDADLLERYFSQP